MENEKGYFVYKNEIKQEIYDHPNLLAYMSQLNVEFSFYKFTIYRCAAKLSMLQKLFFTERIPYKVVLTVLDRHRFVQADETIKPVQLTALIHDIFFACDKFGYFSESTSFDLETATEVLSNFFWNVFDPYRKTPISLLEIKETFLLLCEIASLDELIAEYFNLAADHNRCISRFRFELILRIFAKIFSYIGESESYGAHIIPDIVDECFIQCPGMNGINEYQFNCIWGLNRTKFLIYTNLIALVKRIKDTEKFIHNTNCASCKIEKIIGIRFKCQVCRKLSLCLRCFSVGFSDKKHDGSHRMYEVFSEETTPRKWSYFIAKLCNIFSGKSRKIQIGDENTEIYNENDTEMITLGNDTRFTDLTMKLAKQKESTKLSDAGLSISNRSMLDKLYSIIDILNEEKNKIETKITENQSKYLNDSLHKLLDDHKKTLTNVIGQLHFILQSSQNESFPTSSTPNRLSLDKPSADMSRSIHGAEINKTFLDANKSDYSISELSTWFHNKKTAQGKLIHNQKLSSLHEHDDIYDSKMINFRDLLSKVKEIIDDSYSDNAKLAEATQDLESVLDNIIQDEEQKRIS